MSDPPGPVATTPAATPRPAMPWMQAFLYVTTFASCCLAYLVQEPGLTVADALRLGLAPGTPLAAALAFAGALMAILTVHELGHLVTAQRLGVPRGWPYFIPAPSLTGTLGAVIVLPRPPRNRGQLVMVGAAGPLLGLFASVAALSYGLPRSAPARWTDLDPARPLALGGSVLFDLLRAAWAPADGLLDLHPVAFAGWVGLLLTAVNLLPVSQLDGGHLAYGLLGDRARWLAWPTILGLMALGITGAFSHGPTAAGWAWLGVLLYVAGTRHPAVEFPTERPSIAARGLAVMTLLLATITFVPQPFLPIHVPSLDRPAPHRAVPDPTPSRPSPEPADDPRSPEEFRL